MSNEEGQVVCSDYGLVPALGLDLRRGYEASFPPNQVNDSNKGSNGPAGSRSGKLHSEERDGLSVTRVYQLNRINRPDF